MQVQVTKGNMTMVKLGNVRMIGTGLENKGILVTASDDIVVYADNKKYQSSDSFLVIPCDVLGTDYYTPSWPKGSTSLHAYPGQIGKHALYPCGITKYGFGTHLVTISCDHQ
jgi:hypothetical protein